MSVANQQYVISDEQLGQTIKEVLAGAEGQQQEKTPAAQPFTMKIGGQDFTFNTPEEAAQQFNHTLGAMQQQITQLQQTQKQPTQYVTNDEGAPAFSQEEFSKLLIEDARKGIDYALRHTLFDGKVDNAAEIIKQKFSGIDQTSQVVAVNNFLDAHKEVAGNPQIQGAITQVAQQLGLPTTREGLELAYLKAQAAGLVPAYSFAHLAAPPQDPNMPQNPQNPFQNQYASVPQAPQFPQQFAPQAQFPAQPFPAMPQYAPQPGRPFLPQQLAQPQQSQQFNMAPPPPVTRSTPPPSLEQQQHLAAFEQMSVDQMEQVLRKYGAQF